MKKNKVKKEFLEQIRKVPIVQVACEKVGVSRNSVYRWRKEDIGFAKEMDTALEEGEALVNDMSESQLLSLIREKNWNAISFWLRKRNPKFRDRVEVITTAPQEQLSPEQEATVKAALKLAAITVEQPQESQAPSPAPSEDK
jgi:hypothetical protein